MIFEPAGDRERFLPETNDRRERRAALRLQAQENARCFEDRGLALPVAPDEKVEAGSELDGQRFETSKIPELKFSEHDAMRIVAAIVDRGPGTHRSPAYISAHRLISSSLLVICAGIRFL